MENESELLRVSQVAKLINVSPATIYAWVGQGRFPCYKFVGAVRIKRSDFVNWCKSKRKGSKLDGKEN
jgi:excisionase family DNA binding protein